MLDKSEVFIQKKNENTNVTSTSKIIIINFRPGITVMALTDPDTMRLD